MLAADVSSVDPAALQNTLQVLGIIGGTIATILGLIIAGFTVVGLIKGKRGVEILPNPLPMQQVNSPVTHAEIAVLKDDIEELKEAMEKNRDVAREAQTKMYNRINELTVSVATLAGSYDVIAQFIDPHHKRAPRAK